MQLTHAPSGSNQDQLLAAVRSVIGREVRLSDELEADLALDSVDLARVAAALPYDLYRVLASYDFDRLTALTVADLEPAAA